MALLPILHWPDERLHKVAKPVETINDEIRRLVEDMAQTMYAAPGIGLAAPQVAVHKRIIVVDAAAPGDKPAPYRMANPEIVWASDDVAAHEEGCLSFPDQYAEVARPNRVRVRYLDHENEIRELEADGMLATCIQHEMDHLDGVLFVDHISMLKRNIILRKMSKLRKTEVGAGA